MNDETEGVLLDELLGDDDGPHPVPPARYAPTSCIEEMLPRHIVEGPDQEMKWPYQWLAFCSCGRGIRCNSETKRCGMGCAPVPIRIARSWPRSAPVRVTTTTRWPAACSNPHRARAERSL